MTKFDDELKKGRFVCSECQRCNKFVWPPNNYCNICFGEVIWRPVSPIGKLVEFSKKDDVLFCIAEFEGQIRVMGLLESSIEPEIGQFLKLVKCRNNGKEEFVFQSIK